MEVRSRSKLLKKWFDHGLGVKSTPIHSWLYRLGLEPIPTACLVPRPHIVSDLRRTLPSLNRFSGNTDVNNEDRL